MFCWSCDLAKLGDIGGGVPPAAIGIVRREPVGVPTGPVEEEWDLFGASVRIMGAFRLLIPSI